MPTQITTDIGRTYGALLFGASVAFGMTGVTVLQSILYFKLYQDDGWGLKAVVALVMLFDTLHSAFLYTSLDHYFVKFFSTPDDINHIFWGVALTILVTGFQILLVHIFFCVKIFKSSKRNLWITVPIMVLALTRFGTSSAATGEMLHLQRFSAFNEPYPGWLFTTGLVLSVVVDLLIAFWLCYFLRSLRESMTTESTTMIRMVNVMTLYTFENGALTSLVAVAVLICWLLMPRNLVFLGIHFVVAKIYANSVLTSLNTRKQFRAYHHEVQMRHEQPWRMPGYWSNHRPSQTITALYTIKEDSFEESLPEFGAKVKTDPLEAHQRHTRRPTTASTI